MPRILIVAADSDLRRSLEFALNAEGYEVTSRASVGGPELLGAYDCTVVDHHALGNDMTAAANFCSSFAPVILLANKQEHELAQWTFRIVLKPLLGPALTDAVSTALETRTDPKQFP